MAKSNTITNIDYLKPIPEEHVVTTVISSEEDTTTALTSFTVNVDFSEPVTGFVVGDIVVTNGTKSAFAGSGRSYSFTLSPTAPGAVTVNVAAAVAKTRVGYENSVATEWSITFTV